MDLRPTRRRIAAAGLLVLVGLGGTAPAWASPGHAAHHVDLATPSELTGRGARIDVDAGRREADDAGYVRVTAAATTKRTGQTWVSPGLDVPCDTPSREVVCTVLGTDATTLDTPVPGALDGPFPHVAFRRTSVDVNTPVDRRVDTAAPDLQEPTDSLMVEPGADVTVAGRDVVQGPQTVANVPCSNEPRAIVCNLVGGQP